MIRVFDQLDSAGLITDKPIPKLPPTAWTDARNVRFENGGVEKFLGHSTYFSSSNAAEISYVLPFRVQYENGILYHSGDQIYLYDGSTHTNVTPAGDFVFNDVTGTTHAFLPGGVIVLNNETDAPIYTVSDTPISSTPVFQTLPAWPSGLQTRYLRSHKNFLFALSNALSGNVYAEQIRWSNRADPGSPPTSWDYTDTTQPTGLTTLPFEGFIMDAVELRDSLIIYQENNIYQLSEVGGATVFAIRRLFQNAGAFNARCVVTLNQGHVVLGSNDVFYHDGTQINSIADRRVRDQIFSELIDQYNPYVCKNVNRNEIWFCLTNMTDGSLGANIAWVWNWSEDRWTKREIPNSYFAEIGDIGTGLSSPKNSTRLLLAGRTDKKVFLMDDTNAFAGTSMTSYVERRALPLGEGGQFDQRRMKFVREITPQITGTAGGVVNIYVGHRDTIDGTRTWEGPFPYTIGTTRKVDCRVSGRVIDIKFESTTDIEWLLTEYGVNYRLADARR